MRFGTLKNKLERHLKKAATPEDVKFKIVTDENGCIVMDRDHGQSDAEALRNANYGRQH